MYGFIVHFDSSTKPELMKLLNSKIIRYKDFRGDYAYLKTRKIWKFYWFNYRFRKFPCEFFYFELSHFRRNVVLPVFIQQNFSCHFELIDAYTQKLTIDFSNIHDAWKIKLSMFLNK